MTGVAIFGLKFPSLLKYDEQSHHPAIQHNLKSLYRVGKMPQLCGVFTLLMMLAFLVDQVQALCSDLFRAARQMAGSRRGLWDEMRFLFKYVCFEQLEEFYTTIIRVALPAPVPDTA